MIIYKQAKKKTRDPFDSSFKIPSTNEGSFLTTIPCINASIYKNKMIKHIDTKIVTIV